MKTALPSMMLIGLTGAVSASAGTYNFYFNNAEQGDNSTATPKVVVKDGEQAKDDELPAPSEPGPKPGPASAVESENLPPPETLPPDEADEDTDEEPARTALFEGVGDLQKLLSYSGTPHFRLTAGATENTLNHHYDYDSFDPSYGGLGSGYSYTTKSDSPSLSASFFPVGFVGATVFWSIQAEGVEGELIPLSLGRDGLLQLGFLGGGAEHVGSSVIEPFVGGRIQLNLARNWGVTFAYRRALHDDITADDTFNSSFDAALVVRL